jgi:hypothetical protein
MVNLENHYRVQFFKFSNIEFVRLFLLQIVEGGS